MTIELTAFEIVPDFAKGFVKDLRVRWALEEAGLAYTERLIGADEQASAAYRRRQPFAQVPVYRDDEAELFESGAIVLHLAERSEALSPTDPAGRARVKTWVCAALNSIDPFVANLVLVDLFYADAPWAPGFEVVAREQLEERLRGLADWLGDKDYLEDRFTAGDLMMTTVLRDLIDRGPLELFPTLDAYRRRCEARPAFQRALNAQLAAFERYEGAQA
ncbi:MAG: glutathione S-transferase family protein [Pseudomonadota bacterium]